MPRAITVARMPRRKEVGAMPNTARNIGPRFKVSDIVQISGSFHTGLNRLFGRVVEVRPNQNSQSLDKYLVLLNDSAEEHLLWDMELKPQ